LSRHTTSPKNYPIIQPSELILRPGGALYHLDLLPGQVAETIITVGDPERVNAVSRRFDKIELKVEAREFVTHTGELDGKRLTVISTGIGTDNIDIVFNELDALFNIDLERREVKSKLTRLDFVRLGTSGAFQPDLPLDSLLEHLEDGKVQLPVPILIVRPELPPAFEMETSGIYGLATALGHRAASVSALLANRAEGTFSKQPAKTVERLIEKGLALILDK